jgi:hypothetical protein
MGVDLRMGVPVLPICRRLAVVRAAVLAVLVVAPVAVRATNILHPQAAGEMVRRARCEVAYSSALRGAGGMRKTSPGASV